MTRRPKIDHFRIWHVDPDQEKNKLLPWLYYMLEEVALYFGIDTDEISKISHRISFREALESCSMSFRLRLIPQEIISTKVAGLPIIARDKKIDEPVLLLPHGDAHFLLVTDVSLREFITIHDAVGRFDQVTYLTMTNAKDDNNNVALFKKIIPSFLPWLVVIIFSIVFLGLFICFAAILKSFFLDNIDENQLALYFFCGAVLLLIALISAQWYWLSKKNFLVSFFLIVDDFLRRVLLLDEENISTLNKSEVSRLMIEIRQACKNYFFHRLEFFLCAFGILLFLVWALIAWGLVPALILLTLCMIIFAIAFVIDKKRKTYLAHAHNAFDHIINILESFRRSFAALSGLKASSPLIHQLLREKDQLIAITSRISSIDFFTKASIFFLPAFFVLMSIFFIHFIGEPVQARNRSSLLMVVLAVGVFLSRLLTRPRLNIDPFVEIKNHLSKWPLVVKTRVEPVNIEGMIELDNVSFAYKNNGAMVVNNYNLTLKAHQFYVLYGPASVGKTTLLKIMMGIFDPIDGHVVIDGQDMRSLNKASLRRHFGVVLLESKLIAGTVFENIMCGRDISSVSLKNLLMSHEIFDCLIDMPMGMNTYVFWHTKNLSRFEKSIIFLARALVHEPKILFIDDLLVGMSYYHQSLLLDYLNGLTMTRVLTSSEKISSSIAINVKISDALSGGKFV